MNIFPLEFVKVEHIDYISSNLGGQDWVAAKRMLRNDKDVVSNPAPTRNKKADIGGLPYRR